MTTVVTDGKIELIPIQTMQAARGIFPGIDTTVPNDDESFISLVIEENNINIPVAGVFIA